MNILGISAFYHDSAACLIRDGAIVAAASEERFTRKKHDFDFPKQAALYCLKEGGITAADLDYVGFYDKPLLKFERILYTYLATFPKSLPSFAARAEAMLEEIDSFHAPTRVKMCDGICSACGAAGAIPA